MQNTESSASYGHLSSSGGEAGLTIIIDNASGLQYEGSPSKLNPYVVCELIGSGRAVKTIAQDHTSDPVWDEEFRIPGYDWTSQPSLQFTVFGGHGKSNSGGELLGSALLESTEFVSMPFHGGLKLDPPKEQLAALVAAAAQSSQDVTSVEAMALAKSRKDGKYGILRVHVGTEVSVETSPETRGRQYSVHVLVPEGLQVGDTFFIMLDGEQVDVAVPDGCGPGSILSVEDEDDEEDSADVDLHSVPSKSNERRQDLPSIAGVDSQMVLAEIHPAQSVLPLQPRTELPAQSSFRLKSPASQSQSHANTASSGATGTELPAQSSLHQQSPASESQSHPGTPSSSAARTQLPVQSSIRQQSPASESHSHPGTASSGATRTQLPVQSSLRQQTPASESQSHPDTASSGATQTELPAQSFLQSPASESQSHPNTASSGVARTELPAASSLRLPSPTSESQPLPATASTALRSDDRRIRFFEDRVKHLDSDVEDIGTTQYSAALRDIQEQLQTLDASVMKTQRELDAAVGKAELPQGAFEETAATQNLHMKFGAGKSVHDILRTKLDELDHAVERVQESRWMAPEQTWASSMFKELDLYSKHQQQELRQLHQSVHNEQILDMGNRSPRFQNQQHQFLLDELTPSSIELSSPHSWQASSFSLDAQPRRWSPRGNLGSASNMTEQSQRLQSDLEKLARSFVEMSTKTFKWSAGLSAGRREVLAAILLEHALPCEQLSSDIAAFIKRLEFEKAAIARATSEDSMVEDSRNTTTNDQLTIQQLLVENTSLQLQSIYAKVDRAKIQKAQEQLNQLYIENASLRQRFADSDTWVKAAREQIETLTRDNQNLREQLSVADAGLEDSLKRIQQMYVDANRSAKLQGRTSKGDLAQPVARHLENKSPKNHEAHSANESSDDCLQLRFDNLVFSQTNQDALKKDLLNGLLSLGLPVEQVPALDVYLREGSAVAELRGSADLLQQISLLPLNSLRLRGCPARQVFAF